MLNYVCDKCGKNVADNTGSIHISTVATMQFAQNEAKYERERLSKDNGIVITTLAEIADRIDANPEPSWRVCHDACAPDVITSAAYYAFGVEEARTPETVLGWTVHFIDSKDFIETSNLGTFVRTVMARNGVNIGVQSTRVN